MKLTMKHDHQLQELYAGRLQSPDARTAAVAAIDQWRDLNKLIAFAIARHGYGDSDSGFGLIYSSDQDDFDKSQHDSIPEGSVEAYGFWGPPEGYEVRLLEVTYLEALIEVVEAAGASARATTLRELERRLR